MSVEAVTRCYLDVAVVRIQQWLARTPDLKGWRGASAALSHATSRGFWVERLPAGVEWNDDAGDIDGVVSLRTVDGMTGPQAEASAQAATVEVAAGLRAALPAVMVEAAWVSATGYDAAYGLLARRRFDGLPAAAYPSAPPEVVLAKPCDACRSDPAVAAGAGPNGWDLCLDCVVRYQAAGATASRSPALVPRAEQRLRQALVDRGVAVTAFPDDFAQVAEWGRIAEDDEPTQLALIYADGNRVGHP